VSDFANTLGADARARLERVLEEGERTTGAQVVVALFPSLEGESLEDFSIKLAEKWRVGRKGLDDGAIIVAFINDRKLRIEVGYGLEGAIPDVEASRIIRESIAPRFREGRYEAGLEAAARAIYATVETKTPAERRGPARGRSQFPWIGVIGFFAILAVIAAMLLREAATTRGFTRGGYTAGGRGWGVPPIVFFPPMGGGRRGDSGGGGFGGFSGGGGSFGGGGASGDW
jgi:uncharacterized protein